MTGVDDKHDKNIINFLVKSQTILIILVNNQFKQCSHWYGNFVDWLLF